MMRAMVDKVMPDERPKALEGGGGRPRTKGLVHQVMERQFSTLHPVWIEQHLNLLCELRRVFGGDLDTPIILAVIGQRYFETIVGKPFSYSDALDGKAPPTGERLTNIESVAEAAGIPRETVRRKVNDMIRRGWIIKGPRGALTVTAEASNALATATHVAYTLLDVTFEAIAGALVEDGHLAISVPQRD
jgi:hypothetical protein